MAKEPKSDGSQQPIQKRGGISVPNGSRRPSEAPPAPKDLAPNSKSTSEKGS
jgi:hypothetical protein